MNFGTESCDGLDKHACLNGHVQRAIDVHAFDWMLGPELRAAVHLLRKPSRPSMPISLSKCQMLPTMALLFIFFMRSRVMILDLTAQDKDARRVTSAWQGPTPRITQNVVHADADLHVLDGVTMAWCINDGDVPLLCVELLGGARNDPPRSRYSFWRSM